MFDKIALSLSYGELERVVIAYPSFVPHQALFLIRQQLAQDFPNMRVEFLVRGRDEIKQGIVDGSIHFGLANIHESTAIHSFDSTFLGHVEFLPYVQASGRLAQMDKAVVVGENCKQKDSSCSNHWWMRAWPKSLSIQPTTSKSTSWLW
ncbi:LysR substrate-binding domain-containing protein [Vibrio parahaemolyticus]|uniref:LysR substrate-binding domain-containing protein n=1 Tax=Vibrio parahaemolyticus TaxID=670 RepID=UPI0034E8B7CD